MSSLYVFALGLRGYPDRLLVELYRPELTPGDRIEVILMVENPSVEAAPALLTSFFGHVVGCFADGPQADAFIRAERDAWER